MRRLAKLLLEHKGYRVLEAGNGDEALAIWAERRAEIDLLLTDMIMPGGCSGRELAVKIRADRDDIRILYTTGYSPDTFSEHLTLTEGVNFLGKPYSAAKLAQTVRHCLDTPASP